MATWLGLKQFPIAVKDKEAVPDGLPSGKGVSSGFYKHLLDYPVLYTKG